MRMIRCASTVLSLCVWFVMTAGIAHAEVSTDLRVKLGGSAGIDTVEFENLASGDASQDGGGNFQLEAVFSQEQEGPTFVGGVGIFGRTHKGNVPDPFLPTDVQYDAAGLSGTAGVGVKANENLHFEGRAELDLGRGKPSLSTPGAVWNSVQEGDYVAWDLIVGGYYTVGKPGLQIGLELGVQTFSGEFQIWNNAGFWNDGKVKGNGGIANLVVGVRF
jgi:hypothetical protein